VVRGALLDPGSIWFGKVWIPAQRRNDKTALRRVGDTRN